MIKKPFIGKKVYTGNSFCCGSGFKEGTKGVITKMGSKPDLFLVEEKGSKVGYWHCNKCVSPRS